MLPVVWLFWKTSSSDTTLTTLTTPTDRVTTISSDAPGSRFPQRQIP